MSRLRIVIPLAVAAVGLTVVPALADQTITAGPPCCEFTTPNVTMDQGEKVSFRNNDVVQHDVTAIGKGDDGKPLFFSRTIGSGQSAAVEGTEFLTTGSYDFYCQVHGTSMDGRLTVSANGTPAQRPATPPPGSEEDTRAPAVSVSLPSQKLANVVKRGKLTVSVKVDEASKASLTATMRYKGKTVTVATGAPTLAAGTKTVSLTLTKSGKKILADAASAKITVSGSAKDAKGNAGKARAASRTLKP